MDTSLVGTFRFIDQDASKDKMVKEFSLLRVNSTDHSWFKDLMGHNDALDSKILHFGQITINEFMYILKCDAENKIYGFAVFLSTCRTSMICSLYEYAVSSVYRGKGIELIFLNRMCEDLRNQGFHDIFIEKKLLNYSVTQPPISNLEVKGISFSIMNSISS